jgi:hypothetical protein
MKIKRRKNFWGAVYEETEVSHDTPERRRGAGHSIQQDLEPDFLSVSPCAFCAVLQDQLKDETVKCCLHAEQYKKGEKNENKRHTNP